MGALLQTYYAPPYTKFLTGLALVAQALDKTLFDEVTRQLKAKAIQVKTGALVDATIIALTSEDDEEGRWVKHKGRPAVHGFKAHVGADTALVEETARPLPMLCLTIPAQSRRGICRQRLRSTAFVAGSRRSSAHGNEAMAFAECDGEAWQSQACKFASLPSPTL